MKPPLKLFFVDVETTGTDPRRHGIVQLSGLVEIGKLHQVFDYTVAPFPNDIVVPKALAVSHRTVEEVEGYDPPQQVYQTFLNMLDSYIDKYNPRDKFHLIGYNAIFDMRFLREWFKKNGNVYFDSYFFWPPLDVSVLAHQHLIRERRSMPNFKQSTVAAALGIELDEKRLHDSLYDIELCKQIYNKVKGDRNA